MKNRIIRILSIIVFVFAGCDKDDDTIIETITVASVKPAMPNDAPTMIPKYI